MSDEPPLHELSDDELFLRIYVYNSDEERHLSESAFAVINQRYAQWLYTRCAGLCRRRGCPNLAEDIAAATLTRAFEKADTYDAADCKPENLPNRTKAWLGRIAQNLLTDHQRNPNRPSNPLEPNELELEAASYSTDDFSQMFLEGSTLLPTPLLHRQVAEAFETLDNRTQIVLLETFIQRTRTPSGKAMRRGSAKLLADHLETSQDNVRRIRRLGILAINDYLESSSSNQQHGGKQDES